MGGPRQSNTGLKIILIPVIHWRPAVCRSGFGNANRCVVVGALLGSSQAVLEIRSERGDLAGIALEDPGLDFEALRFVYRALKAVTKAQRECHVRSDLPRVLNVFLEGLRGEVSNGGGSWT